MLTTPRLSNFAGTVTWSDRVDIYIFALRRDLADTYPGVVLRMMCHPKLSWMEEQAPPRFIPPLQKKIRAVLSKKLNNRTTTN